eukprot:159389-Rhodomonas_salina.1
MDAITSPELASPKNAGCRHLREDQQPSEEDDLTGPSLRLPRNQMCFVVGGASDDSEGDDGECGWCRRCICEQRAPCSAIGGCERCAPAPPRLHLLDVRIALECKQ